MEFTFTTRQLTKISVTADNAREGAQIAAFKLWAINNNPALTCHTQIAVSEPTELDDQDYGVEFETSATILTLI